MKVSLKFHRGAWSLIVSALCFIAGCRLVIYGMKGIELAQVFIMPAFVSGLFFLALGAGTWIDANSEKTKER